MEKKHKVKVHGVFRSGTNLAKYLLLDQFDCEVAFNESGHKHLPFPYLTQDSLNSNVPVVVCLKNPIANLVSLFKYAQSVGFLHFECGRDWDEFIRERFIIRMNADPSQAAHRFNNPIDYWNSFYYNALSLPAARTFVMKYEDLLAQPHQQVDRLHEQFPQLKRVASSFQLPKSVMARSKDGDGLDNLVTASRFEGEGFYLGREYLKNFNQEQMNWLRQNLDRQVMNWAGYQMF